MIGFAFCHGWGYDATALLSLSAALRRRFANAAQLHCDLGFGGNPVALNIGQPERRWIAIGHSYGFSWLLQQGVPWAAAISLNGFTRFCRKTGSPQGTPARLVDAMLERLQDDAPATVSDFRLRCGMRAAHCDVWPSPDAARLVEHLRTLRDLDITLPDVPLLALAGESDAIVPPELARACFASGTQAALLFLPGDHLLPLNAPEACADAIADFLRDECDIAAARPSLARGLVP